MRRFGAASLVAISVAILQAASAAAQDGSVPVGNDVAAGGSAPDSAPDGVSSATEGLSDIVVTAQRRSQSLSKVPLAVQALDAALLESQAITNTRELIQASPSVGYQGGFSIQHGGFLIRGVTSNSSEGGIQQSTAMLIDGVSLTRPGEFVNELGDIERVEILRGPQGTLLGKNSTAGAISIVTRRPTDGFEGQLQLGATTDEEYSARAMLNIPIAEGVRSRFNAFFSDLDPLVRNLGPGRDVYGRRQYAFRGKLEADLASGVRLALSGDYSHQRNSFIQGVLFAPNTGFAAAHVAALGYQPRVGLAQVATNGRALEKAEGYGGSAELTWDVADRLVLTSLTAYRRFKADATADYDLTPVGLAQGIGFTPNPFNYPIQNISVDLPRNPNEVRYFTQEVRVNYSGSTTDIVGGVFYQTLKDVGRNDLPFLISNPALPAGSFIYSNALNRYRINDDTIAVFADITQRITSTISLFGGARFTHEKIKANYSVRNFGPIGARLSIATPGVNLDSVTGAFTGPPLELRAFQVTRKTDNLSGRAGIQWQPTTTQNYFFSYNTGYKGPAVDVSRAASAPNPATGYTPIVAPEKARSFELGTKQQLFDRRLQLSLNLYDQKIDNLQQNVLITGTNSTFLINAGALKSRGVEMDFRALVVDGLSLDGGLSYTHADYVGRFSDGSPVLVSCYPNQTVAEGCVNGRFGIAGIQARGSYRWRYNLGATYANELPTLPFGMEMRVAFAWYDDTPQLVGIDPLTQESSRGMLDASITLTDDNERWALQVFGRNLTDDFYFVARSNANNFVGRGYGTLSRDFKRYGGVKLTYSF